MPGNVLVKWNDPMLDEVNEILVVPALEQVGLSPRWENLDAVSSLSKGHS